MHNTFKYLIMCDEFILIEFSKTLLYFFSKPSIMIYKFLYQSLHNVLWSQPSLGSNLTEPRL